MFGKVLIGPSGRGASNRGNLELDIYKQAAHAIVQI